MEFSIGCAKRLRVDYPGYAVMPDSAPTCANERANGSIFDAVCDLRAKLASLEHREARSCLGPLLGFDVNS